RCHARAPGVVECQGARSPVQPLPAGVDRPALPKPGVPADAHPGQQGYVLAPQPRRAPPRPRRQPDVLGPQPGAPRLEEVTQLRPAGPISSGRSNITVSRLCDRHRLIVPGGSDTVTSNYT